MFIDDIKLAARISGTSFDGEVQDLIDSAKADLMLSGLTVSETDMLCKKAIVTYVQANFGPFNEFRDKYMESYEAQKAKLALSQDYVV